MDLKLNCKDLAFQLEQFGKDYEKRVVVVLLIRRVGRVVLPLDGLETELRRY